MAAASLRGAWAGLILGRLSQSRNEVREGRHYPDLGRQQQVLAPQGPRFSPERQEQPWWGGVGREGHGTGRQTRREAGVPKSSVPRARPPEGMVALLPSLACCPSSPLERPQAFQPALAPGPQDHCSAPSPWPGLLVPLWQVTRGGAPGKEGRITRFGFPSWAQASWVHLPPLGNKSVTWIPEVLSWHHGRTWSTPSLLTDYNKGAKRGRSSPKVTQSMAPPAQTPLPCTPPPTPLLPRFKQRPPSSSS